MFEWTLTVGNVITFLVMFSSAMWVVASMRAEIRILDSRLLGVEQALTKTTDILVMLSRQDERMKSLEQKVEQMYEQGSKRLHTIIDQHIKDTKD